MWKKKKPTHKWILFNSESVLVYLLWPFKTTFKHLIRKGWWTTRKFFGMRKGRPRFIMLLLRVGFMVLQHGVLFPGHIILPRIAIFLSRKFYFTFNIASIVKRLDHVSVFCFVLAFIVKTFKETDLIRRSPTARLRESIAVYQPRRVWISDMAGRDFKPMVAFTRAKTSCLYCKLFN